MKRQFGPSTCYTKNIGTGITSPNIIQFASFFGLFTDPDEWFAEGWDSGCEDSASGSTNQTEGKNTPFTKGYN